MFSKGRLGPPSSLAQLLSEDPERRSERAFPGRDWLKVVDGRDRDRARCGLRIQQCKTKITDVMSTVFLRPHHRNSLLSDKKVDLRVADSGASE